MNKKAQLPAHIDFGKADHIHAFETTGRRFFREVLDLDWDAVLINDASALRDFSFSGMPEGQAADAPGVNDLKAAYSAWDQWVIARIDDLYGVQLETTRINLMDLWARIEGAHKQKFLAPRH